MLHPIKQRAQGLRSRPDLPNIARPELAPAQRERTWISSWRRRQSPADKRHQGLRSSLYAISAFSPGSARSGLNRIRFLLESLSRFRPQEARPAAHQPPILLASLFRNFLKLK
ncbi:hypothetical protein J5N97_003061 [Dioscorea zingiberensis]|uniref:Uncharacterized protein n=1 Tax=Dioscorea zingiberensis TaxID=325984 RepID=A0A9D5HPR0_9LILI|nr:hypothetical protein J5N97_003061 [Dioscorea zingiberensis]